MKIRFVDLFAGLGGFRIALDEISKIINIDTECVFVSEIDKEAIKTYQGNFGSNEKILNIRDLDEKCSQCPNHDFLFAGFPCQTFSNAGKKRGFLDEIRGTLFFDVAKILKNKKPKYILLENVKHLVSHDNGQTWKIIMKTLDNLGYAVPQNPIILSPHLLNIPQERNRVFIPGVLREKMKKPSKYIELDFSKYFVPYTQTRKTIEKDYLESNVNPKYFLDLLNKKDNYLVNSLNAWGEFVQNVKFPKNQTLPVIWVNELRGTKMSSKFPSWKKTYLIKMRELYKNNKQFIDEWFDKYHPENWKIREQKLEWQAGAKCKNIEETIITLRQSGIRCKKFEKFPTLVAMVQTTLIFDFKKNQWRHLTPKECARLQSFPENYKMHNQIDDKGNDFFSYKQFGNSLNLEVVKIVEKELLSKY